MADVVLLDRNNKETEYTNVETISVKSKSGEYGEETFISERLILTQLQSDWE